MKFKKMVTFILLILTSITLGSFLGSFFDNIHQMSWLNYTIKYSLSPMTLDLSFFSLTFGISLSINIAQIILLITAVLLYPKVTKIVCAE